MLVKTEACPKRSTMEARKRKTFNYETSVRNFTKMDSGDYFSTSNYTVIVAVTIP